MKKYIVAFPGIDKSIYQEGFDTLKEAIENHGIQTFRDDNAALTIADGEELTICDGYQVVCLWEDEQDALATASQVAIENDHLPEEEEREWVSVNLNGLDIKVPAGTTQEQIQEVLGAAGTNCLASQRRYAGETNSWDS